VTSLTITTHKVYRPLFAPGLRYLGAHGGRGSGKSHHFAERIVDEMVANPTLRVVCIREVQSSLRESAYRLIGDKISALGVGAQFEVRHDRIETAQGGLIMFVGMQDHTSESIKSLESITYAWVEEAQTLSEKSLELLRPTIRAPGSQIWFSWNPRSRADAVDKFLRGDDVPENAAVVQVNYDSATRGSRRSLRPSVCLITVCAPIGTATSGRATMSRRLSGRSGQCGILTMGGWLSCRTICRASW
jgi:phage terminase large subunit